VVDELEHRYPQYDGLNLSFETREGILKHCSRANAQRIEAQEPGGVARRFCDRTQPGLEAQLCNLADEIAYNAHDIDDGVRSGLIGIERLSEVGLFDRYRREALAEYPELRGRRVLYETIRRMLSAQVYDVIDATTAALASAAPSDADAVRQARPLVLFSESMRVESTELKRFLFRNLYRHPQVTQTANRAQGVVRALFAVYVDDAAEMPEAYAGRVDRYRAVADYIAGMTDRFAIREYERLTGQRWAE
jgi:dGTPase